MYNLHAVIKPETFPRVPLNTYGFATSVLASSLLLVLPIRLVVAFVVL